MDVDLLHELSSEYWELQALLQEDLDNSAEKWYNIIVVKNQIQLEEMSTWVKKPLSKL